MNKEPLPPIENNEFDGEKFSTTLNNEPCKHDVVIKNNEIRCLKCGNAWGGPQIARLYEAFKQNRQ